VAADKAQSKAIAAAQDMRHQMQSEVAKMRRKSLEDTPSGSSHSNNGSKSSCRGAAAEEGSSSVVVGEPVKSVAKEDADVEVKSQVRHHHRAKVKPLPTSSSSSRPPSAPRQLRFEEETSEKLAR